MQAGSHWYNDKNAPLTFDKYASAKKFSKATLQSPKNKNDMTDPILKSFSKCHTGGYKKCKNYSKIPFERGWTDVKIQHLHYYGLNLFQTDHSLMTFPEVKLSLGQ